MSRTLARSVGALAVATALLTSTTVAFAAAPLTDSPSRYQTEKKKTTTLGELSPRLQQSAIKEARSSPKGAKLAAEGRKPHAGVSDLELDLICGDWFIMWEEDADGNPILGTFTLDCGGTEIPLP